MRIVAIDPGKNDFAYAVIRDGRCWSHGHVRTITSLYVEELPDQLRRFSHDITEVLRKASAHDWLAFERMQHRPRQGGGAVSEYINLMIGIVMNMAQVRGMKLYPVPAVTWKTHFIRQLGIDRKRFTMVGQKLTMKLPAGSKAKTRREYCAGVLDGQPHTNGMTPHEGDAVGIGSYCWEQLTGVPIISQVLG